ncbi:hypothetical protein HJC04_14050 [Rhizobium sp. NLR8a]|uniref:hypothetical protein n=1 Tax=Rhizobium sp. NLR8a TaxID=2731119 RepID=UPI001C82AA01|nr:hypothetical protein [Rhizobium sp. NLR8a]MBX5221431.1 hypothetical protein [Rhizobium sp. NLR8a]
MTNFAVCHREMPVLGGLLQRHIKWLRTCGVPMPAIVQPELVRLAHGYRAADGRFDPDPSGPDWFAFSEDEDVIFWRPKTGQLATWNGRSFALGEAVIDDASGYALGGRLHVFADPLDWLRACRKGIVVLDWARAFDELRHCPRVAVAESLLPTYRSRMRPARMPQVSILRKCKGAAL